MLIQKITAVVVDRILLCVALAPLGPKRELRGSTRVASTGAAVLSGLVLRMATAILPPLRGLAYLNSEPGWESVEPFLLPGPLPIIHNHPDFLSFR